MADFQKKKRRSTAFHAPGVKGRATGFTAKTNLKRQSNGMVGVDAFFSSDDEDDVIDQTDDSDSEEEDLGAVGSDVMGDEVESPVMPSPIEPGQLMNNGSPDVPTPQKRLSFAAYEDEGDLVEDSPPSEPFRGHGGASSAKKQGSAAKVGMKKSSTPVTKSTPKPAPKLAAKSAAKPPAAKPPAAKPAKAAPKSKRKPVASRDSPRVTVFKTPEHADGHRRSGRAKVTPTQFWKGERVVIEDGEVRKVKPETPAEERAPKRRRQNISKSSRIPATVHEDDEGDRSFKEDRSLKALEAQNVIDWTTDPDDELQEAAYTVGKTPSMMTWRDVKDQEALRLCKCFSLSGSSWASGMLEISSGGSKPPQNTKNNFLVFVVLSGTLEVTIHETTSRMGRGSQFFVPPRNSYALRNTSNVLSKLSYTQVKMSASV